MKRQFSLLFVATVLLTLVMVLPVYATDTLTVTGSTAEASVGEQVTVSVSLESNPGIFTASIRLDYDTEALTLVSSTNCMPESFTLTKGSNFYFESLGGEDVTATGELLSLTFKVNSTAEDGTYPITIRCWDVCNYDLDDIDVTVSSGSVKVVSEILPALSISTVSLTLYNNLAINYKVDETLFTEAGYSDPYMIFEFNSNQTRVDSYTVASGKYVFAFKNIAPNMMGDTVYGTLYATYDGEEVKSKTVGYSIKGYCDAVFEYYNGTAYAELRTMLVDLLNYGAASQTFTGYKTENLVNGELSAEVKAEGSQQLPQLENVLTGGYERIDDPTVTWTGVGLMLNDSITMRFKISADDIQGLSLKVSGGGYNWTIDSGKFVATNGGYYVYFNGFSAYQVREHIYATVYKDGKAVSNTLRYSVESYAQTQIGNTAQPQLASLVDAMMKYGIAAYNYTH